MSMISVKTKEGRVAFDGPRGEQIPNSRFKLVVNTNWVQRLIHVHGDLEVEGDAKQQVTADAKPVAEPDADVAAKVAAKSDEQSGKTPAVTQRATK